MQPSDINELIELLLSEHPNAICELDYSSEFELLIAVILSAQCTDKRVNIVTKTLFAQYNTPYKLAEIDEEELKNIIKPCGFFNTKARSIIECSRSIIERYGGVVPRSMEALMSLRGVGRKTANVMLSVAFKEQAIAVDTHVKRLAKRLGLSNSDNVLIIEQDLMQTIPKDKWSLFHHLLIHHGRYTCLARAPKCGECMVSEYCKFYLSR